MIYQCVVSGVGDVKILSVSEVVGNYLKLEYDLSVFVFLKKKKKEIHT